MCDSCKVCSAYPDEQVKLDNEAMVELELIFKLQDLLDDYGYDLNPILEDGMPSFELVKQTT